MPSMGWRLSMGGCCPWGTLCMGGCCPWGDAVHGGMLSMGGCCPWGDAVHGGDTVHGGSFLLVLVWGVLVCGDHIQGILSFYPQKFGVAIAMSHLKIILHRVSPQKHLGVKKGWRPGFIIL